MILGRLVLVTLLHLLFAGAGQAEALQPENSPPKLILTAEEKAWLDAHPVIRVASDPDYAPFQFTSDAGESDGIANDFLRVVAERLGVRFEYLLSDSWSQALQLLKDQKADMLAAAANTPERQRYLRFTESYIDFPDVIITRSGQNYLSLESLSGKRLITLEGTAINEFLRQQYPDIDLVLVHDVKGLLQRISTGEVDAGVLNLATTSYAIKQWKITNLHISNLTEFSYELSFASRRDWPILNRILSKALATINEEERQRIFNRWISFTTPRADKKVEKIQLTKSEQAWLDEHPVILAAADPDWPPIEYLDRDDDFTGMAADYVNLIEQRLGIRIEVLRHETWSQALQSARDRKVALLTAVASTPDRDKYMSFTRPYLELPASIIINEKTNGVSDLSDLRGKTVAIVKNYASHDYLERKHPELELLPVANMENGLYAVSYGEVDALVANVATASYYIEKLAIQNLRVAGETGFVYKIGLASRNDWPVLQRLLQKSIDSISNEEQRAIYRKWIGLKPKPWRPSEEHFIGFAGVLILLGFGMTLVWNRQLRKTVEFRTRELRASEKLAGEARETAEIANRTKTDFLAAASHDLRQPLHAMSLQIGMLKDLLENDTSEEILSQISSSHFALSEILNALLDISHLDSGNLKPRFSHFPAAQLFKRLETEFMPLASERGIPLRIRTTHAWLYSDPALLYRVLANLVDNAVKQTGSNGVLIAARKRGGNWRIEVWDGGPGIPEEKRQEIFEKFVQLDRSDRNRGEGIGLGLAIVQRLDQLLGLQLTIHSRVDSGSCFRLLVTDGKPIPHQSGYPLSPEERGYHLQGAVILVVDDDPNALKATGRLLRGWNCAVVTASTCEAALSEATDEDIDIIIADYRLTDGHTGLDVIEALHKQSEKNGNKKSKAVIITGDVDRGDVSHLRECQYPILRKPVAPITLRSTLHKLMID